MRSTCPLPKWPTTHLERTADGVVCGIDEAGYSPLAGPVVAAAVILPRGPKPRALRGLTDSKLLSPEARAKYFDIISRIAEVGVGTATVAEIDSINIFNADMLAMRRAVEALPVTPDSALVDGRSKPPMPCPAKPVVKGDRRCLSIAAASVIAKVVRDRVMQELAREFTGYGWLTNVGYGTDEHYLGLLRQGPTSHHRRSFAPLATLFARDRSAFAGLRFQPSERVPDLVRLQLLQLRQNLLAVFDGSKNHIGLLKNVRGRWTFQAMGYRTENEPVPGGGPCASCHGARLSAPERKQLIRLLSAQMTG